MSDSTDYKHTARLLPPTIAMGGGSFEAAGDESEVVDGQEAAAGSVWVV